MLIISKDKDYYDGVVGTTGIDNTIVFERKFEEVSDLKKFPIPFRRESWWNNKNKLIHRFPFKNKAINYTNANYFILMECKTHSSLFSVDGM